MEQHEEKQLHFAICIANTDCKDLPPHQVYQVLPDDMAAEEGYLRIIDDSGKDYPYPADYFLQMAPQRKLSRQL